MFISRRAVVVIISLLLTMPAFAADPTADLLGSTRVKDFIRVMVVPHNGKDAVQGAVDTFDGTFHPLDGRTFASDGDIGVYVANFNPLTQSWTIESTASVDPNYNAIKLFLDDLKPLQESFKVAGGGGEETKDNTDPCADPKRDCDCLRKLITSANKALQNPGLTAEDLKKNVNLATGQKGVMESKASFKDAITQIDTANKTAQNALDAIRAKFGTAAGAPKSSCPTISSDVLVDYVFATGRAERVIAARAALAAAIADLVKNSLDPYTDINRWRISPSGAPPMDLAFTNVEPTFENQQTINASLKTRTIDVGDGSLNIKTAETGVSAKFILRRDSFWVPERAAAMIYNRITYPKWGTKQSGSTITVHREDDTQPVSGAMMLNLIPRIGRPSAVYPMLQIGVSSAKDFPGFLAGVGLRFTAPVAFSLSAGGIVTRFKDLDKSLKEGDVITGTSDIDKHLVYRTSPVALYAAIQVKF
jgi:hypothetical protein